MDCYFFGVKEYAGHFLYLGNQKVNQQHLPKDFPVDVYVLDGKLLPPKLPQEQGRAELVHVGGWTVLTFWDRSEDKRLNCNSSFLVRGQYDFQEVVKIAKDNYPKIWSRFDFEVYERKQ